MRKEFSAWVEAQGRSQKDLIFLTGDLGFAALENVEKAMQERFVNAGVAEQNMVSMAAALAQQGLSPLCYSIAPFCVFRPSEQIRVDVCLHNLNVKIVGNGGGYGYGIMGATHHAIEDLAMLSSFQNMKCFIPLSNEYVAKTCAAMMKQRGPGYLRLGYGVAPEHLVVDTTYAPFQQLKFRDTDRSNPARCTVVGLGPVLLNAVAALKKCQIEADVFSVNELPLEKLTTEFLSSLKQTQHLLVVEEHVRRGGLGENLGLKLLENNVSIRRFLHKYAVGYPNHRYGSQAFHQTQSGLDEESLCTALKELIA